MKFFTAICRLCRGFAVLALLTVIHATSGTAQDLPTTPPTSRPVLDLRIGATDTDADLSQIVGMVVDKAGRMFVLDAKEQAVLVYAPNGTPLKKLGRKGSGPGEFEHATSISIKRDSLWVLEGSTGRLTAFAMQNGAARTSRVIAQSRSSSQVFGVLANGHLISVPVNSPQTLSALPRFQFVRVDERGAVLNNVLGVRETAPIFGMPLRIAGAPNSKPFAMTQQRQPFLAKPMPVISADGRSVIAIASQESSKGCSKFGTITIVAVGMLGDTLWIKNLTHVPVPITDAHVQLMIDSLSKPITVRVGTRLAGDRKTLRDSLKRPATWPAVTELLAGLDGTVWLKRGAPLSGNDSFWYRLSPTGAFETMIRVPSGLNLMQASRDRLWGWRVDNNDIPIVERYRY